MMLTKLRIISVLLWIALVRAHRYSGKVELEIHRASSASGTRKLDPAAVRRTWDRATGRAGHGAKHLMNLLAQVSL